MAPPPTDHHHDLLAHGAASPVGTHGWTTPLTVDDVAALGDVLSVWAHPDDEAYLAAGTMAAVVEAGRRVVCVTATRGEQGGQAQPSELARTRTTEMAASLAALGVDEHVWLDLPDGGCADLDPEGPVEALAALVRDIAPDTIVTFGPDGVTGHGDHRAVSRWVSEAVRRVDGHRPTVLHAAVTADYLNRFGDLDSRLDVYEPGYPTVVADSAVALRVELTGPALDRKVRALRAHASQTADLVRTVGSDRYRAWVACESFSLAPTPP